MQRVYQEVANKSGFGGPPRQVRAALEEAWEAVVEIAALSGQPVELLPRTGEVLEMQTLLVTRELGGTCVRVGEGPRTRLRVLADKGE